MPRLPTILTTVAIVSLILGGTHYYFWARWVRDLALPPPWPLVLGLGLALAALSLPVAMFLARSGRAETLRPLFMLAFVWMGTAFFLLCTTAGVDLVRLITAWVAGDEDALLPTDPARRLMWQRGIGAAALSLTAGTSLAAYRIAARGPVIERVAVTLARLPRALDGFTVAQISDLHVSALLGRAYVQRVVELANGLAPDLVAVTGDLIDGSVAQLREAVAPLAGLRAAQGVFFITGNHEYYSGADAWLAEVTRLGMRPLRNERVVVGTQAASFDLAGVDDLTGHGFGNGHGSDIPRALAGRDPARELVLLAHQPRALFEAAAHGVGLMLSGHTHGGQIWPFGALVRLVQPVLAGLARHGNTQIYVNRGTGYWGPPMRLRAPPELTLVTLRAPSGLSP